LAEKKFRQFSLEKSFYVVANEQDLHMQQLFKTLELMKFKKVKRCKHISYNTIRLPTGKMSSRTGENVLYSDFLKELTKYSMEGIKKRDFNISEKELEKRALKISIAAIKYSMLKQNPNKNIIFMKEESMNFEGNTGPYLLYSYARANSILKKIKKEVKNFEVRNLEGSEIKLVKKISEFPEIVLNAYESLNPSMIANYSYQLCQIFNEFYHACPVINSEREDFRINLVKSFRQILKNALELLGIEPIEEM